VGSEAMQPEGSWAGMLPKLLAEIIWPVSSLERGKGAWVFDIFERRESKRDNKKKSRKEKKNNKIRIKKYLINIEKIKKNHVECFFIEK